MTDTPIDVPRLELDSIIGFNGKNSFPTQKFHNRHCKKCDAKFRD
jgi:hypothetical protein